MIVHHIAIQTRDLRNSIRWYQQFFGASLIWELSKFSYTTRRRLPGIRNLAELQTSQVRFHIFERAQISPKQSDSSTPCFQHLCLETGSLESLNLYRARWIELFKSDDFSFDCSEQPTEIEWDGSRSASFYLLDVNGVEYELTWFAGIPSQSAGLDARLEIPGSSI